MSIVKKNKIYKNIVIFCVFFVLICLFFYILKKIQEFKMSFEGFDTNIKKIFITFGAGGENYIQAGERLKRQANDIKIFDETILYTDEYLKSNDEFWGKHSEFIKNNKRGYGYWLWKPYIIKKTMEKMKDGDVLLYADCGCEINIKRREELLNDIKMVKDKYIIGSRTKHIEKKWNKMDLLVKLNANNDKYMNTIQNQAGVNLFLICDKTRDLVNEWYEICCDYHLIDDSPSILPNTEDFIEHRHDQSVFSLLTKKYNIDIEKEISVEIVKNISGISIVN
jgi:hypothetical protein